jgi:rhamnose transport system permease protein
MTALAVAARGRRELSVAAVYVGLLAALATWAPAFYGAEHFRGYLVSNASVLVVAVGMTLVILCRQIDISVGTQFSLCGVAAALMAREGVPMPAVVALTMALGAALGAINGVLVGALGLPSIIVTLATMVIGREALRYLREGDFVRGLPPSFQWFGLGQAAGQWVIVGLAVAVLLAFAWGMRNLAAGRAVYATGSDPEAARLAGVRPRGVVFGVFVVMGALAGLSALLSAVRFVEIEPNAGAGLELAVIASVVVGGTAVSGGRGNLWGTLVGVLLLGSIGRALVFLGAEAQWEKALQGLIILLAVASDAADRGRR